MPKAKGAADMLEVARLYYLEEQTKDSISKQLQIDPRTVTAMLKRAKEAGIVEIRIREEAINLSLEERLREKYPHLLRVLTLPLLDEVKTSEQHAELVRRFGVLAAQYFEEFMSDHRDKDVHMAVSGGASVFEAISAIQQKPRPNLYIYVTAIVGYGMLQANASHVIPAANATILWEKSGRNSGDHLCYATAGPLPVDLDKLYRRPAVKAVIDQMEKVDLVFGGLGVVRPDRKAPTLPRDVKSLRNQLSITDLIKSEIGLRDLDRAKVIGDFSYLLITADGEEAKHPLTKEPLRYFLSGGYNTGHPGVAFYQRLVARGKSVVVVAGPFKLPAIRAALRGKLFNVLVTDEKTAKQLLEDE